jgi:serine protease AprX
MTGARLPGFILGVVLALVVAPAFGGTVSPELLAMVKAAPPQSSIRVIVTLTDRVDLRQYQVGNRMFRDGRLVQALKAKAATTQGPLQAFLQSRGVGNLRELWAINGIAVTVPAFLVELIAQFPGVATIRPDALATAPAVTMGAAAPPEWNLTAVRAPDLWSLGLDGTGIVVANMDTGVDAGHPDLAGKWRGGANSWYDPHGQHATPYDPNGHGTQTMAIMVGGSAGGTSIGMAPSARWIAVKMYNDAGLAIYSDIHLSFQWLLDPDGNPATPDAPDVVNASWGLLGTAGQCLTEFNADIQVLKTAGIAVVFAAGNDGPGASTSLSPANNPSSFSVGAVDSALAVAQFSARGPSACDAGIFPKVTAPGVNINTADLSFGGFPFYAWVSGTSYAAPHVAGAVALLLGAAPTATVGDIEAALTQGARDLGIAGADNGYGFGLADALAAYDRLLAGAGSAPTITSTPVTTGTQGQIYAYTVTATDPAGQVITFSLDVAPAGMTIGATTGAISWTPTNAQVGTNAVTVRATNTDGRSALQSFTITVANVNDAPVAVNDAYTVSGGAPLNVAVPGVLANDTDPDKDALTAVLVASPAHGTLTLNANGSLSYTATPGYSGTDTFTYRAFDGALSSNVATVTITIDGNRPPVAGNDAYAVLQGTTLVVPAPGVLGNDTDPDGNAITAVLVAGTTRGTLTLNANGSFNYKPNSGVTGTDQFTYRARDGTLFSATATVTITVAPNRAPVAANDNATAPVRGTAPYAPVVINVVANDTDPDGNLNPSTVAITTSPNKGGTVTLNGNGTVSYTPKRAFVGKETFRYTVRDTSGATSNAATVTVTVQ